jgi:hypothetical protein
MKTEVKRTGAFVLAGDCRITNHQSLSPPRARHCRLTPLPFSDKFPLALAVAEPADAYDSDRGATQEVRVSREQVRWNPFLRRRAERFSVYLLGSLIDTTWQTAF